MLGRKAELALISARVCLILAQSSDMPRAVAQVSSLKQAWLARQWVPCLPSAAAHRGVST